MGLISRVSSRTYRSMSSLDSRYILAAERQRENPVLKLIEKETSVKFASDDDPIYAMDFRLGKLVGALFLSISYHKRTPEYIVERMRLVGNIRYETRILI